MVRFTFSGNRGEYCATCLRVLVCSIDTHVRTRQDSSCAPKESHSLVRNPLQRSIIVKPKVTSMNDVIRTSLLGQFIQRPQVP